MRTRSKARSSAALAALPRPVDDVKRLAAAAQRAYRAAKERERRAKQRSSKLQDIVPLPRLYPAKTPAKVLDTVQCKLLLVRLSQDTADAQVNANNLPVNLECPSSPPSPTLKRRGRPRLPATSSEKNLTLHDASTGAIILQRVAPTSLRKRQQTANSAVRGKQCLDAFLKKQSSVQLDPNRLSSVHYLGIWHTTGNGSLDFTKETREYRKQAFELLKWAKDHTRLVFNAIRPHIHPSFQANLASRAQQPLQWLKDCLSDKATRTLHPWYTTIAFFATFSPGSHRDTRDETPSVLFNFGSSMYLEIPEYGVKITVNPLDVVILNSRTHSHRTQPTTTGDDSQRWAMSCFYRSSIFNMHPCSRIAAKHIVKVFGESE
ncbi:hypothetical protein PaG_04538 [Moesziomyces aphidis]|uniref:2OGFeDO JBP1/TET oxygenase domain-containing protein n=1 Tax=Moesziomyces aphidis TaxID=84754 RepID=W3VIG3_MOEAP|nr:hypothetical protein PaG_04538 [Moesziomyces aphidis]